MWSDSALVPALNVPTGAVLPYAGSSAPDGYLLCDGSAVSRTTYATLFAAIGTNHGAGDGSTTFNVPDTRGRAPIGAGTGSGLTARTLGGTVGNETHTLSTSEIPAHNHNLKNQSGAGSGNYVTNQATASNTITLTTENAGGGGSHNNMQPSYVLNFIIKT